MICLEKINYYIFRRIEFFIEKRVNVLLCHFLVFIIKIIFKKLAEENLDKLYTLEDLRLWTIKTPTSRRDIRHKVTVTKVILNDRWCKMGQK